MQKQVDTYSSSPTLGIRKVANLCNVSVNLLTYYFPTILSIMAIRVVEFSNGGYNIRKIFA